MCVCVALCMYRYAIELTYSCACLCHPPPPPSEKSSTAGLSSQPGQFTCPITSLDTNGRNKFSALWGCGCVFSDKALKVCVCVRA